MKSIVLWLAAVLCCGVVQAQVPRQINYQGYLTDPGGTPVSATLAMEFRLYNVATSGAALFTEAQSVTVNNGVFNVMIGAQPGQPLGLPFDVPYWLGVKVGVDAEMTPRQPLAAAPYAIRAASAEALAAGATVPGSQLAAASVTAGKLAGSGCGSGQILKYSGSAWACAADDSGGVAGGLAGQVLAGTGADPVWTGAPTLATSLGIGTTTADATLHVRKDAVFGLGPTLLVQNGGGGTNAESRIDLATYVIGANPPGARITAIDSGNSSANLDFQTKAPGSDANPLASRLFIRSDGNVGIGAGTPTSKLTVAGTIESTSGGVKFPDGATQTKALANCSAEGDVAVMRLGVWVCRSALGYVDNGDGTVTDYKTGLMWEKKTACGAVTLTDPHCVLNTYTWSAASPFTEPTGTLYTDFLAKLNLNVSSDGNTFCFANYCDWRIPNIGELQTILASCPGNLPCINAIFGPTQLNYYWSSSSLASNPGNAWDVGFLYGGVGGLNKSFGFDHARAVRSGR